MKAFIRIGLIAGLIALTFLISPSATRAQNYNYRGCAWPLELSPEGSGNVQAPDRAARYWVMPFDTQYQTMTIKGTYPNVRYFSFAAYETTDSASGIAHDFPLAGDLSDTRIAPDPGSINPFVRAGGRNGTYTVVISRTEPRSGNTIAVSRDHLVWVVMRMYVADADPSVSGRALMGTVTLPTITLDRSSQPLETCSPINKWLDASALAQLLFPPALDPILDFKEGAPTSDRLWFAMPLNPPSVYWPNPDNKYMWMWPGDEYQPGRIIVIHAKAPGFPGTFDGSPIWVPAQGFRSMDMRYWAVCEVEYALPFPAVDCATDLTTRLEGGYYTIVISDDLQRPDWLRPNINWLPYGDEQYPKFVLLRNMLPAADFPYAVQKVWEWKNHSCTFNFSFPTLPHRSDIDAVGPCAQQVMGDYYPVAVWCDKSTFLAGGFRACSKE